MMRIGTYEVGVIVTDRFRLDGGAMFGSVPKSLWHRSTWCDDENRIKLVCRLLYLSSSTHRILIDCGMGRKWTEKERAIFAIEHRGEAPSESTLPGLTDLVITHLHFDHGGGISVRANDEVSLAFPDAVHHVNEDNWKRAQAPGVRERASYLPESVLPLQKSKLHLTKSGETILPRISVHQVNGHTQGLQWILIEDNDLTLAYPSDLMPTSQHIPIPYVMGYDLHAEWSMAEKEFFLAQAADRNWVVVFEHDPEVAAVRIKRDGAKFVMAEKVELPEIQLGRAGELSHANRT